MKKYIITIMAGLLISSPGSALAITPGYGGDINCVSNYNVNDPNAVGHPCSDDQDQFKRLYNLEVAVQQLQAQNSQLEAKIGAIKPVQQVVQAAPAPATPATDPQTLQRVTTLETKVSKLEQAMSFLQDTLLTAVNKTISLLTKLLAR